MRFDIKKKFMLANIAIILPMFILFIYFSVIFVDQYNLASIRKILLNDSYILQLYLYQYLSEHSTEQLSEKDLFFLNYELSKMVNLRSQMLYISSNIQVDSKLETADVFSSFRDSQEIKLAIENKKNYNLKKVDKHRYLLMAFPFFSKEGIEGVVRLICILEEADNQKSKLTAILSGIGFLVLIAIILLYQYFTDKIVFPLYKLNSVVQSFASGNLENNLEIDSGDEIEELANSFNKMSSDISLLIDNLKIEKSKQKDFYNNMTHEIRTPLTTILGYADIIKRVDSRESREECLRYIESEGKRLLRMINELLKSSKLNLHNFEINKGYFNISKLIEETVGIIKYKANKYGIKFNFNITEDIFIDVDKDKIKEVILNLIDNAIKYSGTDKIDISLMCSGRVVLIEIEDYGKGISRKQLEKINKDYTEFQETNISNHDGHGYGLFITKKIIELHDGEFVIDGLKGKGTLISIKLYK
ncbi:HAMP domain-containing sensor histidine kinase [Halocella sp. SP3-1]|uniref:sensor histidine kinase n=1 Tax=Halocella sp. SP3-1 TaxID=2382161 RepID=UPI000F75CF37|nr:HAMP domain-containing sensor histidine kinase [Halocella sp. SP3-1]AZO93412.1 sensor histidine kinase [Halocella sp. SP3-1]